MHFGVLNYEKQHKEGTCKVSGRSVVFSAFYADFCLCPKLLIITTLIVVFPELKAMMLHMNTEIKQTKTKKKKKKLKTTSATNIHGLCYADHYICIANSEK